MSQTLSSRHERTAALLERAYRMALLLQARSFRDQDVASSDGAGELEALTLCIELVELLDDARSTLVVPACPNEMASTSGWFAGNLSTDGSSCAPSTGDSIVRG